MPWPSWLVGWVGGVGGVGAWCLVLFSVSSLSLSLWPLSPLLLPQKIKKIKLTNPPHHPLLPLSNTYPRQRNTRFPEAAPGVCVCEGAAAFLGSGTDGEFAVEVVWGVVRMGGLEGRGFRRGGFRKGREVYSSWGKDALIGGWMNGCGGLIDG